MQRFAPQHGISLVELIMFIVIVSIALAGILLVMNVATKSSSDPLIHKQALAIAESLLEETELMPFTYCDPVDPVAATANSTLDCTAPVGGEAMGPETGETRYSTSTPFDNVNDYKGFNMAAGAINDIFGNSINMNGYSAAVTMSTPALGGINGTDVNGAPLVLLINVTVTGPDGVAVTLEGYRIRYSPKA